MVQEAKKDPRMGIESLFTDENKTERFDMKQRKTQEWGLKAYIGWLGRNATLKTGSKERPRNEDQKSNFENFNIYSLNLKQRKN